MSNDQIDYTFILKSKTKTRFIGGEYDKDKKQPVYSIEASIPSHVASQVLITQFITGSKENYSYGWDINNNSTWPAYIIVKRNDELLDMNGNIKKNV